jgi:A-macroglobulin receptor binding domain
LRALAHTQSPGTYWALETNTPFYGWGIAGRVETTAIAIQALAYDKEQESADLKKEALLFLLHNKDRYGVWYSTQATVNVLEAMQSVLTEQDATPSTAAKVEVLVNGQTVKTLALPLDHRMLAPITVDLSAFVKNGMNRIELERSGVARAASFQIVSTYYVPWAATVNDQTARVRSGDSESLRLETHFDRHEAQVTQEITCQIKAERIGFEGYGMLLAEIGLPPGSDVDRASLETAMRGSDSINQYDVLPDRVVIYLWPRAGGSDFSFKFRPRIAMTAKSAPSVVYDYYNPEAKAVIAPGTFVVK